MSMLCSVYRVSAEQIHALVQHPGVVAELLDAPVPPPRPGLLAKLLGKKAPTGHGPARSFAVLDARDRFELDAVWHILHYVFTGLSDGGSGPGSFVMQSGQPVGRNLGYGPPRFFDQAATRGIAEFLDHYTQAQLAATYQPDAIAAADIYWKASRHPAEAEAQVRELWQCIQELRQFVSEAAQAEGGLLVEIY